MRKHRKLLLVLLCLVALAAFVAFLLHDKEPSYQGRPLSYWVEKYGETTAYSKGLRPPVPDEQAAEAIAHIGTNALPFLLARIRYEPEEHRTKKALVYALEDAPSSFRFEPLLKWASADQIAAYASAEAFAALGSAAKPAIPELVKMMRDPALKQTAPLAQYALANIGRDAVPIFVAILEDPKARNRVNAAAAFSTVRRLSANAAPAIPTLVRCLGDKDPAVQSKAAMALGKAALEPELVVPALIGACHNTTNSTLRRMSIRALGAFGPRARVAEAELLAALRDPEENTRRFATNSLRSIAPEALTNAPAQ